MNTKCITSLDKRFTLRSFFAFLGVCLLQPSLLQAQPSGQRHEVTVIGVSSFRGRWSRRVRQRAIQDGFRRALRKMLSQWSPVLTARQALQTRQLVEAKAAQFVYGFRVMSERILRRRYRVTLLVYVEKEAFLSLIRRQLTSSGQPILSLRTPTKQKALASPKARATRPPKKRKPPHAKKKQKQE